MKKDMPALESDIPSAASADGEAYVVESFVAERQTPQGLEILVQWEGYPEEDWTWEPVRSLAKSVPEMVKAWNGGADQDSGNEENSCDIQEVKKILGHRKFKGVAHYLVK